MDRRKFIASSAACALAGVSKTQSSIAQKPTLRSDRLINAYYFRAHMYTMVPRQVKEDLQWMRDMGCQAVSISILEQDFYAAVENIEIICNVASDLGMEVYAVPARWAGLFAGAPKVPSMFSITNPHTWVINEEGKTRQSQVSGVISSIHYPETVDFVKQKALEVFKLWDIKGIIWDEPKLVDGVDCSPMAIEKMGLIKEEKPHVQAFSNFLEDVNLSIKSEYPDKSTHMFAYSNLAGWKIDMLSRIKGIDSFGCDGRPWYSADGGKQETSGKVLLGEDGGERFLTAAARENKKTLWLIENHNLAMKDLPILEKRLPEVLSKQVDHLIVFYYPRNLEDPDRIMNSIRKAFLDAF